MVLLIRLVRPKAVFLLLRRNCLFLFVFTGQILQLSCSTLTPDVFPKNIPAAAVPSVHSLFVGIPQFRVLMFCLVTKGSSQLHTIETAPQAGVADPALRRYFYPCFLILLHPSLLYKEETHTLLFTAQLQTGTLIPVTVLSPEILQHFFSVFLSSAQSGFHNL